MSEAKSFPPSDMQDRLHRQRDLSPAHQNLHPTGCWDGHMIHPVNEKLPRDLHPSVELSGERAADEAVQVSREPVLKGLAKACGPDQTEHRL